MGLIRLLLVVMVALSASLSGAMDVGHTAGLEQSYAAMGDMADDQLVCCSESSERGQTCHVLPAMLPSADVHESAPATCEVVSIGASLLLKGIEPTGPLDPPRAM